MKSRIFPAVLIFTVLISQACKKDNNVKNPGMLQLISTRIGNSLLDVAKKAYDVPLDESIKFSFSGAVDTSTVRKAISIQTSNENKVPYSITGATADGSLTLSSASPLEYFTDYKLVISSALRGSEGETFSGAEYQFRTIAGSMVIDSVSINAVKLMGSILKNVDPESISIKVSFSQALNPLNYKSAVTFNGPPLSLNLSEDNRTILASATSKAKGLTKYQFTISPDLTSAGGFTFQGYSTSFYTQIDSTYLFPQISDDDLLDLVQRQTFKYFWDFGHPSCGMARERNSSGDVVTTGGSGFGIMAMIVAMERGYISRSEGISRLEKILTFLEMCDRFHGAWPHWLNGVTGKTVPFSSRDNGGDLVETSYMLQGLLAMRHYLNPAITGENTDINRITALFNAVEFDWYTNGEKTLYWAWSPDYGYNLKIQGYNETLITYVIAASSPTHTINPDAYTVGYAGNGSIKNGKSFYGYVLPLGQDYGGPLFFTQYSFLGLDPRNLKDQFADYWEQNVNQSLINWAYCQANPRKYPGYGPGVWGLTASDNPWGYNAHSPTNDLGVITPTAAISSIVYTPEKSMNALRTDYYFLGDRLWGDYGFYDAFDVTEGWWANSTLAIDQGPIICMIENYRSGLLWNLFMSDQDVRNGLTKLGFTY